MTDRTIGSEEPRRAAQLRFSLSLWRTDNRRPRVRNRASQRNRLLGRFLVVRQDWLLVSGIVIVAAQPIDNQRNLPDAKVVVLRIREVIGKRRHPVVFVSVEPLVCRIA